MAYFDIHTHILPGVDDGAPDVATAIRLLNAEVENGVTAVALTPHFYSYEMGISDFMKRITASFKELVKEIEDMPLDLVVGSEVRYFRDISSSENVKKLCIGKTEYMLLELPYNTDITDYTVRDISEIYYNLGIRPVLAHVERYYQQKGYDELISIIDGETVFSEINADSVLDKYSKAAAKLISTGKAHFLASDTHSEQKRPPKIRQALELLESGKLKDDARRLEENSIKLYNEIFSKK